MDRAPYLIDRLDLQPHPEGGHFREVFRSGGSVHPEDDRGVRAALTTIYFLLRSGERSALHRVRSDEVWHFYEGDPLELLWCTPSLERIERVRLGPLAEEAEPVAVVPAGCWQAARPRGAYTLVGCTVGPGFDFADFQLLRDVADQRQTVLGTWPELDEFL